MRKVYKYTTGRGGLIINKIMDQHEGGTEYKSQIQINTEDDIFNQSTVAEYICGNCGKNAKIDKDSGIRCQHCGYRIFYKKRERKMLQYNAR